MQVMKKKMIKYKYILFDLDGTLMDTSKGIIEAIAYTMKKYSKEVPDESELRTLIGPPMQKSFQKLYDLDDEKAMEMANVFRDVYKTDEFLFQSVVYDGIFDLFESLRKNGIKTGIATYKREDYAKHLLFEKGFDKYTPWMYGSDFAGKLTKADIIRNCLKDMGCDDNSEAVYIGDGNSDGKNANEVGMDFIAVTYGFGFNCADDAAQYKPVAVVNSCEELKNNLL